MMINHDHVYPTNSSLSQSWNTHLPQREALHVPTHVMSWMSTRLPSRIVCNMSLSTPFPLLCLTWCCYAFSLSCNLAFSHCLGAGVREYTCSERAQGSLC